MYLEYWGFKKHPFDNVPDPEMYFDMHQSVDDAVSEVLFAIDEGGECLAVVVGPVGVGKTMCLRIVLDSLDHEKHRIAFVTNPDTTFPQLLREIIGQLEGKQCEESRKDRLFEMFNKLIFETSDKGKHVVIFIDEGNVIKPHNLESLRLLTNMQDDKQNLFTIVLAGQPELAKRLEDPRRANLFQRIGVYCKIHGLDSLEMMTDYIDHRMERAGISGRKIFTKDAYNAIWEYSEKGTPRIINKICKLSLKAAETNELKEIGENVVRGIANRFMRTYRKQASKPTEPAEIPDEIEEKLQADDTMQPVRTIPVKSVQSTESAEKKPRTRIPRPSPVPPSVTPSVGIAAGQETSTPAVPAPPPDINVPPAVSESRHITRKEMEDLASKLATERVKNLANVSDPFEEWEKARDEILAQMTQDNAGT